MTKPPALSGTGEQARAGAMAFINWAGNSTPSQQEEARKMLAAASHNNFVGKVFCDEAFRTQKLDHSRTLLVLSLLGEMRNADVGEDCLRRFLRQPFPEAGTLVHGEIIEQTALGTLQAKAADGLAYLRSQRADEEVLWAVSKHPSRIVRAEAIDAYLWNHGDSAQAREALARHVRGDEKIFLDRVRRESGESGESFNRKLATFLKAHPEARAPAPEKAKRTEQKKPKTKTGTATTVQQNPPPR